MSRFKTWITPILAAVALGLGGIVIHDRVLRPVDVPKPADTKTVDGVALGKGYAGVVLTSLADGWTAAAQCVDEGKSISDAQKALQEIWRKDRSIYFSRNVAPSFAKVLPEGRDPATPEERAAVKTLFLDFAKGLRGDR